MVAGIANEIAETMSISKTYYLERWDTFNERPVNAVPVGPIMPHAVACSAVCHRVIVGFPKSVVVLFGL
jgi:hypothetical protein